MQKTKSINTRIHNQEASENSETKCCECWEDYLQTAKEDE
jgi:hypothetical protein